MKIKVEINLEHTTTAILGKNNSGKISFSEIFNIGAKLV